jgi:effector-binding domain-containing protein
MTDITSGFELDRPVLSVLRRMRPDEMDTAITAQVRRLRDVAASSGLAVTGDPFGVFHGPVTTELDGPLEIALPVDGLASIEGEVRSYRLPGGLMANRYAEGPETWFPDILAVYDEVHSWITEHGGTPVGPPRELWHNGPTDPQPLRLTISWPYAVAPA